MIVHYVPMHEITCANNQNAPPFCDKTQMLYSFTTNKTRYTDLLTCPKNGDRSMKVYRNSVNSRVPTPFLVYY